MNSNFIKATTLVVSLASVSMPVIAEENHSELEINLGLGIGTSQSIYKGINDQTDVMPLLSLRYDRFYLDGFEAGYLIAEEDDYSLSIAISGDSLDGERTDGDSQLAGMGDVDSGINLKLEGETFTQFGLLSASIAQDISNEHDGTEVSFGWGMPVELSGVEVIPSVYASWMSGDLTNHYFGVSTNKATANRSAYTAGDAWRYGVEVMAHYPLTPEWNLMGGVGIEWYSDEITDSSIVDEDRSIGGFIGVSYSF